eukprot:2298244-Rhodomonas_salina.1
MVACRKGNANLDAQVAFDDHTSQILELTCVVLLIRLVASLGGARASALVVLDDALLGGPKL